WLAQFLIQCCRIPRHLCRHARVWRHATIGNHAPGWCDGHLRTLLRYLLLYCQVNAPQIVGIIPGLVDQRPAFIPCDGLVVMSPENDADTRHLLGYGAGFSDAEMGVRDDDIRACLAH